MSTKPTHPRRIRRAFKLFKLTGMVALFEYFTFGGCEFKQTKQNPLVLSGDAFLTACILV